jgi:hypothetical protein
MIFTVCVSVCVCVLSCEVLMLLLACGQLVMNRTKSSKSDFHSHIASLGCWMHTRQAAEAGLEFNRDAVSNSTGKKSCATNAPGEVFEPKVAGPRWNYVERNWGKGVGGRDTRNRNTINSVPYTTRRETENPSHIASGMYAAGRTGHG